MMKKFYLLVFCMLFIVISCEKEGGESIDLDSIQIDHFMEKGFIENSNKNVIHQIKGRSENDAIIESLRRVLDLNNSVRNKIESQGFVAWNNVTVFPGPEGLEMFVLPIISETSIHTEKVVFGFLTGENDNKNVKLTIITRDKLDKAIKQNKDFIKAGKGDLPLHQAVILFAISDSKLFQSTECDYIQLLKNITPGIQNIQLQERVKC